MDSNRTKGESNQQEVGRPNRRPVLQSNADAPVDDARDKARPISLEYPRFSQSSDAAFHTHYQKRQHTNQEKEEQEQEEQVSQVDVQDEKQDEEKVEREQDRLVRLALLALVLPFLDLYVAFSDCVTEMSSM